MKGSFKTFIRKFPLYQKMRAWDARRRQQGRDEVKEWERKGCPIPPPHLIKQREIRQVAQAYGAKIFVETGTLHGDMIEAMKPDFEQLYSIELSESLHARAQERFSSDEKVEIIQGDSAVELGNLMKRLDQPVVFWLDGHYSGADTAQAEIDTPIFAELDHIFTHHVSGHAIVIDDAHCFESDPSYPKLDALKEFVYSRRPEAVIEVAFNSIRILPGKPKG